MGESSEKSWSGPAGRRPVVVIQSDDLNHSSINTVVILSLTTNLKLGQIPGNVYLRAKITGIDRDSIINVSQISTIDKSLLDSAICMLSDSIMMKVEEGVKGILGFQS